MTWNDKCIHMYPEAATVPCTSKIGFGKFQKLVNIMATPCNGVIDCDDNKDELNCSLDEKFVILLLIGVFIVVFLGQKLWQYCSGMFVFKGCVSCIANVSINTMLI